MVGKRRRLGRRLVALGAVGAFLLWIMLLGAHLAPPTSAGALTFRPSATARRNIPAFWLRLTQAKGAQYGIDWTVLAAIASVESNFNRPPCPTSSAGARGPMQFLPSTFRQYEPTGNICDPTDSVDAAAKLLLANGAPGNYGKAIFAYNHAAWYVAKVLALATTYRGAPTGIPSGPASLHQMRTLYKPRAYATLPAWAMANGRAPEQVDARILPDVLWVLRHYGLRVNAAREVGHHTHGDGTALDMRPATGDDQSAWDQSALRLAHDLGWTEGCAAAGVAPVCPLVPAIRGIFYNGYPGHGDPAHAGGNAHIHVSWFASVYGNSSLVPPNAWVRVFPVG